MKKQGNGSKEIGAPASGIIAIGKSTPRTLISTRYLDYELIALLDAIITFAGDRCKLKLFTNLFTETFGCGYIALIVPMTFQVKPEPNPAVSLSGFQPLLII